MFDQSLRRAWRDRALASVVALGCVLTPALVGGVEPRPGEAQAQVPGASTSAVEMQWMFQAQRRLESMGIRDLEGLGRSAGAAGGGRGGSSAEMGANVFRARVTAPTLAFLHGLCDPEGGLPDFGSTVELAVRAGGLVEFRATYLGELVGFDGRPGSLWVWDPSRLPERVQLSRSVTSAPGR